MKPPLHPVYDCVSSSAHGLRSPSLPIFPALRSGHRLFQRRSPQKQFPGSNPARVYWTNKATGITSDVPSEATLTRCSGGASKSMTNPETRGPRIVMDGIRLYNT